ncbi:hypothetical protein CsSME_00032267 [Camellia sinensis var. sinensis]
MMVFPLAFICIFTLLLSLFTKLSVAIDTLSPNETRTDNGELLVSSGEAFELGFFSPPYSNNRYLGIWFKNVPIRTPIWVANKNNPISDSSGLLTITATGNIIIATTTTTNQTTTVWSSSNSSPPTPPNNPILQLLDSGNLVVKNGGGDYLWQSFDYPCDTLVPGMKLGWNLRTNQEWFLTSWKTQQDPSSGDYTYKLDRRGPPQMVLYQGSTMNYRSGSWDGVRFGGDPPIHTKGVIDPNFIFDSTDVYYSFKNTDDTTISRFVVNQTGSLQLFTWNERRGEWSNLITMQRDACDEYAKCGPYGICRFDVSAACHCPNGFIPRLQQEWDRGDWSGGCVRRTPRNCSAPEGFGKLSALKLPDSSYFLVDITKMSLVDCKEACLRNCTCVAFALTTVSGCVVWFGELLDMKEFSEHGQDLYIRMAASDLGSNKKNKRTAVITSIVVLSGILVLSLIGWYFLKELHMGRVKRRNHMIHLESSELPLLDFVKVLVATNNFSSTNKLGEGGFGPVYWGKLEDGQEVAVKRLSSHSGQGSEEFKNEIILISKLQHRNLVRLLGCCIEGEEKLLVYEYLKNRSLDTFLFDAKKRVELDWAKRFNIIQGIARGLLYLHRDSCLRVIHRDLKASNILLDDDMNPKISDFGLARTFRVTQELANTHRVMGTFGYMSPEYAMGGLFSEKSDVFSFGVLLLEIVSSTRNTSLHYQDQYLNLLGYAWQMWNKRRALDLMDESLDDSLSQTEAIRCIHIGLLCVQDHVANRPTMSAVVLMLSSEIEVPQPKQPIFTTQSLSDADLRSQCNSIRFMSTVSKSIIEGQ